MYVYLEISTEANDALHVCTVVTQHVLSTKQRDLIPINRYLQTQHTCIVMKHAFMLSLSRCCTKMPLYLYDFVSFWELVLFDPHKALIIIGTLESDL